MSEEGEKQAEQPVVSQAPVFGSAATFTASGFGGFTGGFAGVSQGNGGEKTTEESSGAADDEGNVDPEAECQAEFKPLVQLEEVETKTGEEDEEENFSGKAKVYRFDDGEWKERGVGPCKILKHKENGMCRILMRREKTLKICANHLVAPGTNLSHHMDNEKAFVWSAMDYADEEPKAEMFCIRFGTVEKASAFKEAVDEAERINTEIVESQQKEEENEEPTVEDNGEAEKEENKGDESDAAANELAEKLESTAKVEDN